jgi:hypothetical protein
MSRFVLTAQLQLQAPTNSRQVLGQIRNQLSGRPIEVPVEVRGAAQAQRAVRNVREEVQRATGAADALGRSFGLAVKRFAAFTVASRAVSLFTNSLASAVDEAIDFQREIVKIAQVTGTTVKQLDSLENTITGLATGLGVVSRDLLAVTRILSQAGIRGAELEVALSSLAKSTLAPTFDDITQTAEGAIAVIRQFEQGVGALEGQLGSINAVAGAFAVESGDLIGAVRRFGGVFKSAGGSLEELLALFTSVRQTTRESAESISTGLRTIFTRVQRPETIQYLRELGVELTNAEGRFIGPFKAAQALGKAFADLPAGDTKFISIAEELGGFRQIGKVIPLLQQYKVAQEALNVAKSGQTSLDKDAATAQQALAVQITKVKEEFLALVRGIASSTSFQVFTRTALSLASAFIKIADTVKPLIPLLGAVAAFKFAQGFGSFLGGAGAAVRGLQTRNQGGPIRKFASGGIVPGVGNGDTVPAMLTPGEFVIRKSSVGKMGAGTLAAMNDNKFAAGGVVNVKNPRQYGALVLDQQTGSDIASGAVELSGSANRHINRVVGPRTGSIDDKDLKRYAATLTSTQQRGFGLDLPPRSKKSLTAGKIKIGTQSREALTESYKKENVRRKKGQELDYQIRGPFSVFGIGSPDSVQGELQQEFAKGASKALDAGAQSIFDSNLAESLSIGPLKFEDGHNFRVRDVLKGAQSTIEGYLLEAVIGAAGDLETGPDNSGQSGIRADFDFPNITKGSKKKLAKLFDPDDNLGPLKRGDAKRTRTTAVQGDGRLVNKIAKDLKKSDFTITKANKGGGIGGGTDTVPALLTPGEFVINKSAASKIGASNLNSMNKSGVAKFAKGGAVGGVQRFRGGGGVTEGGGIGFTGLSIVIPAVQAAISSLGDKSKEASDSTFKATVATEKFFQAVTAVGVALFGLKAANKYIDGFSKGIEEGTVGFGKMKKAQQDATKATELSATSENAEASSGTDSSESGLSKKRVSLAEQAIESEKLVAQSAEKTAKKREKTIVGIQKQEEVAFAEFKKRKKAEIDFAPQFEVAKSEQATIGRGEDRLQELKDKRSAAAKDIQQGSERRSHPGFRGKSTKELLKEQQALSKEIQFQTQHVNNMKVAFKDSSKVIKQGENLTENRTASQKRHSKTLKAVQAGEKSLERARVRSQKAALKAAQSEEKLANRRRRLAGAAKFGGKAVTGAAAAIVSIKGIANAIGGYVQELSQRQAEQAKDKGDVSGAADAAGAGAFAKGITDAFSVSGFAQIATDAFSGTNNFFDGLAKQVRQSRATTAADTATSNLSDLNKTLSKDNNPFKLDGGGINVQAALSTVLGGTNEARSEVAQLEEGKNKKSQEAKINIESAKTLTTLISSGASLAQAEEAALGLAGANQETQEEMLKLARVSITLRDAQVQLGKANFDSLKITSAFGGANAAVKAFTAGLTTGSSSLEGYIIQLESARKNIGVDSGAAIDAIEKQLLSTAGGAGGGGLAAALSGQADVARASSGFSQNIGGIVSNFDVNRGNPAASKGKLTEALVEAIPADASPEIRKQIRDLISSNVSAIEPKDLATTDISKLIQKIGTDAQALSSGFFEAAKLQSQHNVTMSKLYQEREKVEATAAESLNKAIDTQIEAGKAFEAFGGARLTTQQQTQARISQFNNVGGLGGLGASLKGGGAGDIRRVATEITNTFNSQQGAFVRDIAGRSATGGAGIFAGPEGVQNDQRPEAQRANAALITFTKQRISLLKEELTIVQAKNREEKSSLEKLISGDVQGFIEGQAAAGAGAALRSGSSGLTSLFSGSALGAGFKSLKGQGLSDKQLRSAEDETLKRFGITGNGALSGTTPEQEAFKAEGRELAGVLGDLAGQGAQFDVSEIAVNKATIIASEVVFTKELGNIANANQGLAKGGTVYANNGMFVPRGTDTVPAMLTPGEFVVNRSAVQRGNNLQMLRAMNSGGGASGPGYMRGGGRARRNGGGPVEGSSNMLTDAIPALRNVFSDFSSAVDKLANTNFSVKLDTTNVNVNLVNGSFLESMKQNIKDELLAEVGKEIGRSKFNSSGDLTRKGGVLA